MYDVKVTEIAERDILDAAIYIAHNLSNVVAANRLLDESDAAAKSLSNFPLRHPLVSDKLLAANGQWYLQLEIRILLKRASISTSGFPKQ